MTGDSGDIAPVALMPVALAAVLELSQAQLARVLGGESAIAESLTTVRQGAAGS